MGDLKKNIELRKKAVVAMELLARSTNDEMAVNGWLMCGVPDGDIDYGDMDTEKVDEYFTEDKNFKELIGCFMRTMERAQRDGLYIDGISATKED